MGKGDQTDHQILEGRIDPGDWKKEMERVYLDLDNIEKEIELGRQRGGNPLVGGLSSFELEVEECRRHIELIVELCRDIKDTCHQDVRKIFAKVAEKLEDDLGFIRKHEMRINQNNTDSILQLNKITLQKKELAIELRALIDSVKQLDYQNKDVQNKLIQVNNRYEDLARDAGGERHLKLVKTAMVKLKKDIKDSSLNEGVVLNTLFSCNQMRNGKHHLYDDALMNNTPDETAPKEEDYNFDEFN